MKKRRFSWAMAGAMACLLLCSGVSAASNRQENTPKKQSTQPAPANTWGLDREDIEWATTFSESMVFSHRWQPQEHWIEGFEIESVARGSVLEERGFRKGDIVRSVNSQPVRSGEDLLRRFQGLRAREFSILRIVVDRAGELLIVEYRQ